MEAVLSRSFGGDHTPYEWLARSVSSSAKTVLDLACGSGRHARLARAAVELARGEPAAALRALVPRRRGGAPSSRGGRRLR